jgi:AcrR family transcriptional regulator
VSGAAARKDRRREQILGAAELIFAEKGYHAAGIADIAAHLGLGHGTFYRYFQNKHDIALAVFDRVMARIAQVGLAEDPESSATLAEYRAQTARILDNWLALAEAQPHIFRFFHEQSSVIDGARLERMLDAYVVYTMRFLQNGVARGFLRDGLDVRATAEMLVALIFEGTRRAYAVTDARARRRWADAGAALMFDGIARVHPGEGASTRPMKRIAPVPRSRSTKRNG